MTAGESFNIDESSIYFRPKLTEAALLGGKSY